MQIIYYFYIIYLPGWMDGWIDGSRTAWRRYGRTSERRILTVTRVVVRWKLETILAWAVIASKSIDATLVAASIDIIALVYICEDKFYMMRTSYEIKSILINRVLTIVPFSYKKKKTLEIVGTIYFVGKNNIFSVFTKFRATFVWVYENWKHPHLEKISSLMPVPTASNH